MVESGAVTIHIGSKISNDSVRPEWSYKKAIKKRGKSVPWMRAWCAPMCWHVWNPFPSLPHGRHIIESNWMVALPPYPFHLPPTALPSLHQSDEASQAPYTPNSFSFLAIFPLPFCKPRESPSSSSERYTFPAFFHASVEFDRSTCSTLLGWPS